MATASTSPSKRRVPTPERRQLLQTAREIANRTNEWLKRAIIEYDRVDLLATEVLGYQFFPIHLRIAQHQLRHKDENLILLPRGFGKSTIATVTKAIHLFLKDPNIRILIASKSGNNAISMLKEIKAHLEKNDRFREVFGNLVDDSCWSAHTITIASRTEVHREGTIDTVGVEGSVVSRHYNVILGDDLVDEDQAGTAGMREKTRNFYYKILMPCLNPGGMMSIIGTRYHPNDLYGHLEATDMCGGRTLKIPALTGDLASGYKSAWSERFSVEFLLGLKNKMGSAVFGTQFQLDVTLMKGDVFDWEMVKWIDSKDVPHNLPRFAGFDLATSLNPEGDRTAGVAIAYDALRDHVFVIETFAGRWLTNKQREFIVALFKRHECQRACIESVQYQESQYQDIKRENPDLNFVPVTQSVDKKTRAWNLAGRFERQGISFVRGNDEAATEIVGFPKVPHDDYMDALDLAIRAVKARGKKSREREPGLI